MFLGISSWMRTGEAKRFEVISFRFMPILPLAQLLLLLLQLPSWSSFMFWWNSILAWLLLPLGTGEPCLHNKDNVFTSCISRTLIGIRKNWVHFGIMACSFHTESRKLSYVCVHLLVTKRLLLFMHKFIYSMFAEMGLFKPQIFLC